MQMPTGRVAPPANPQPIPDLRTRRKLRTRRALQQAALHLFAERGYEETTVADIAERAEVGLRTFFVHFPTKEDVLFDVSREDFPDLFRLIVAVPAGLSDLAALEVALLGMYKSAAPDLKMYHQMTQLLVRAAASSSVVRGRRMANSDKVASVVASALAQRRGETTPTLATITLAEAAMRMFHLAVDEWATASAEDIAPIFTGRFDALRQVAADRARVAPRRTKDRRTLQQSDVRGADALFSIHPASPNLTGISQIS
jgi:AcrR family transcriptional regulator